MWKYTNTQDRKTVISSFESQFSTRPNICSRSTEFSSIFAAWANCLTSASVSLLSTAGDRKKMVITEEYTEDS